MGREEDVGRLQIAMNDASGVRGVERVRQRSAVFQKVGNVEGAAKEALLQRLPFEQLHDEKPAARIDPDIVHGADVRVIDAGDRSRLPFEPRFRGRLARGGFRKNLQRHFPMQAAVAGAIHLTHPSGAEEAEDLVRA